MPHQHQPLPCLSSPPLPSPQGSATSMKRLPGLPGLGGGIGTGWAAALGAARGGGGGGGCGGGSGGSGGGSGRDTPGGGGGGGGGDAGSRMARAAAKRLRYLKAMDAVRDCWMQVRRSGVGVASCGVAKMVGEAVQDALGGEG